MKGALHVILQERENIIPGFRQHPETIYHKEYYLFNLSGGRKKLKVLLSDILLVRAIKGGHADKLLYLKGNVTYLIRGHSLHELANTAKFLLQCNKQDLVSPDAINYLEEDCVYLNGLMCGEKPMFITLNRTYKKSFLAFFHYSKKL